MSRKERYSSFDAFDALTAGEQKEVVRLRVGLADQTVDWEQKAPLRNRLSRISFAVLSRRFGIQKFMVLDIERDDGFRAKFLLTTASFVETLYGDGFRLILDGYALRKDESIGLTSSGIGFDKARIRRRLLTGEWVSLRPIARRRRDAHEP